MKKFTLFFILLINFFCNSQIYKYSIKEYQEKFKNIILIINFNSPYYENIKFLKELYGRFFQKIIFYGDNKGSHPEVTSFNTEKGFLLASIITDAIIRHPNFEGYIFLQDDCILNIWSCMQLDLNKLWLPQATLNPHNWQFKWYQWTNMINPNPNSGMLKVAWGYAAMKMGWDQLSNNDLHNLNKNAGENNVPGAQCDMFYIPKKFSNNALRLNSYFKNAVCEYAIPTIFSCLDLQNNWEKTTLYYEYGEKYPIEFTTTHPVKLSFDANKNKIQEVFNSMIH